MIQAKRTLTIFLFFIGVITASISLQNVHVSASSSTAKKQAIVDDLNNWFQTTEKPQLEQDKANHPDDVHASNFVAYANHIQKYDLKNGNLVVVLSKSDKKTLSKADTKKIAQQGIYSFTVDYPQYEKLVSMVKNISSDGFSTDYVKKANKYVIYK